MKPLNRPPKGIDLMSERCITILEVVEYSQCLVKMGDDLCSVAEETHIDGFEDVGNFLHSLGERICVGLVLVASSSYDLRRDYANIVANLEIAIQCMKELYDQAGDEGLGKLIETTIDIQAGILQIIDPFKSTKAKLIQGGDMTRKVFYSFHYDLDAWRTNQVRNIGVVDGSKPVSKSEWETVKKDGNKAIKEWIDDQLKDRSCTVVLIGKETASREWVQYEIETSWKMGKGLVGIYIHNLLDQHSQPTARGKNPFDQFKLNGKELSSIVKTYDPRFPDSKLVYDHIANNLSSWVEEAIAIREMWG